MKPGRRHELKRNVLSIKLSEAVSFVRRHGTRLAWGLLIGVVAILIIVYVVNKHRQKHYDLQREFDVLMASADRKGRDWLQRMKVLADQDDDERIAAQACAEVADETVLVAAGEPGAVGSATEYYKRVLDKFPDQYNAVARARSGLARLALDLRGVDAARAEYDMLIATPELAGYPAVGLAKEARDNLPNLAPAVIMAKRKPATLADSEPASKPATQPATGAAATRPAAQR